MLVSGLDQIKWFRRRAKPSINNALTENLYERFGPSTLAVGSIVYLFGGCSAEKWIENTDNRNEEMRTRWLDELWEIDLGII